MSIPDDVRRWIEESVEHDKLNGISTDGQLQMMQDWLDAQPVIPEPDWLVAPKWANWWAIERCCTSASYYASKPAHNHGQWLDYDGKFTYTIDVPFGIDWRTTLRRRPEASHA